MSEHQWRAKLAKIGLAERDELLRNPTWEAAHAYWKKAGFPPPIEPHEPLGIVHKARLHWLHATDAMLQESRDWLLANGYSVYFKGAEPLTPETRDAQRKALGWSALGVH